MTDTYRGFFVDLDQVVACVPVEPRSATLLNIGTGDGVLVSRIARRYPQLSVTTTDITQHQGWLIDDDLRDRIRVQVHSPEQIAQSGFGTGFDVVLMSDVVHHVPVADRATVIARAWEATSPNGCLVVKDIEERGLRARLSLWSDRYLTGDRHTELIGASAMEALILQSEPTARVSRSWLVDRDYPNYLLVGSRVESRVQS
ncbi:MAG: class I SAM-dependent methyltransferase [Actinomycetales bacterium]